MTDRFAFAVIDDAKGKVLGSSSYHGIVRGHALRRDGTMRDTVMYSHTKGEWPEVKAQLLYQLDKPR